MGSSRRRQALGVALAGVGGRLHVGVGVALVLLLMSCPCGSYHCVTLVGALLSSC